MKIFKLHPNLEFYYKTADGQTFYTHEDAKQHARKLKNKEIKKVERDADEKKMLVNDDTEKELLVKRYTELYGKAPNHNIKLATLKLRIEEKEELNSKNNEDETED